MSADDVAAAFWRSGTTARPAARPSSRSGTSTSTSHERIAVPGFLLGRRYEAVRGAPRYFCFYLTQSPDVLKSAGLSGAARQSDAA